MVPIILQLSLQNSTGIVAEVKNWLLYFYFLNTDFSFTVCNINLKLYEYAQNVHLEGSVSQNFDLGPGFIFMIWNIKNVKKYIYKFSS